MQVRQKVSPLATWQRTGSSPARATTSWPFVSTGLRTDLPDGTSLPILGKGRNVSYGGIKTPLATGSPQTPRDAEAGPASRPGPTDPQGPQRSHVITKPAISLVMMIRTAA